jgi:hypothetical protein
LGFGGRRVMNQEIAVKAAAEEIVLSERAWNNG